MTHRYLQDLSQQIGGRLTQLAPGLDLSGSSSAAADGGGGGPRRCCGLGCKCGCVACVLVAALVVGILALLSLWAERQRTLHPPPPRYWPPPPPLIH